MNPDDSITVIVQNRNSVIKTVSLRMADNLIDVELPAESISTIIIK